MGTIDSAGNPGLRLEKDGSFAVKDSVFINGVIAVVCYAVFLYGIYLTFFDTALKGGFMDVLLLLALVPAILFTLRARSQRVFIRINQDGIFVHNRLLTNWQSFHSATYTQKEVVRSIQDNFVLLVRYHTHSGLYTGEVPLGNTQDKSEEEVIAAIRYFYDRYSLHHGLPGGS